MSPGEGMTAAARAGNKREKAIRRQQLAVLSRAKLFSRSERKTVGAASRCCVLPGPARPAQGSWQGGSQLGRGCLPKGCFWGRGLQSPLLCLHSCEPGAGGAVLETITRLGRPERGSTALVLVKLQMVPLFAQNLPPSLSLPPALPLCDQTLGQEALAPFQEPRPRA